MAVPKYVLTSTFWGFLSIPSADFRERQRGQIMLVMASGSFLSVIVVLIYLVARGYAVGFPSFEEHHIFIAAAFLYDCAIVVAILAAKKGQVTLGTSTWLSALSIGTLIIALTDFSAFGQLMTSLFVIYIMATGLLLGLEAVLAMGGGVSVAEIILYTTQPSSIRSDVLFMAIVLNILVTTVIAFFASAYSNNPIILPEPQINSASRSEEELLQQWTGIVVNAMERIKTQAEFLKMFSEIVLSTERASLNSRSVEALHGIIHAGSRISTISNNTNTLMELSTESIDIRPEVFDPSEVWREILAAKSAEALTRRSYIRFQLDPAVPVEVYHDPRLIMQAVTNLLDNAIQSEPRGGINIRLRREDDLHWSTEIKDPGHGMVWIELNKICLIIQQGELPLRGINFGMGLAAAYRIVHALGGDITISSNLGEGTTVTIILPNRFVQYSKAA